MCLFVLQGCDGPSRWKEGRPEETPKRVSVARVIKESLQRAQDAPLLQTRKRKLKIY